MIATDFTRDDCQLGTKRVTYRQLVARYVCNECGGKIVIRYLDGYYPCCGVCAGQDFVSESAYRRQESEALEVTLGLPPEYAAMLKENERCLSKTEPADALSDLALSD